MRTTNEAPSKGRFAMPYRIDNIDPRTTVMIVVDMQNDFVAEGAKLQSAQAHAMVPKLAATLRFCREKGIRVVYTAHPSPRRLRYGTIRRSLFGSRGSLGVGRWIAGGRDLQRPGAGAGRARHQKTPL